MKARPDELELAEARVFWSTLSASSMVREAITKERAVPEPNDVKIPRYNAITIAYIVGACELCLLAGYLIGHWGAK